MSKQSKAEGGIGVGAVVLIAVLSVATGCFIGFGLSLLWPRNLEFQSLTSTPSIAVTNSTSATGHATDTTGTPTVTDSQPAQTATLPLTIAPSGGDGKTRDNPIALGSSAPVDVGLSLSISNAVRPADTIVSNFNPFNSTPTPDKEYLQVTVSFNCTLSSNQTCSYFSGLLKAVGADGNVAQNMIILGSSDIDISGQVFGGASKTGAVYYLVPKGDPNVVLFYDPLLGNKTYFALK